MIAVFRKLQAYPRYSKIFEWGKLVTITGTAQIIVQLAGLVSGILVIRLLPTEEYALYTLANTMLGTMTMLSDSGLSNGVMAEGGKVWNDRKKLGVVLITGLTLRRKFGILSLFVTLPILAYLLLTHGANWITTGLVIISLIPAFFAALSDSFLEIIPKLHQDIKPLQFNQISVSLGRFALSGLFLFFFPLTFVAIIANSIPRIWGNIRLRKISLRFINTNETSDPIVEKKITVGVKRTLPIVIYHCISAQISIWLVSFFGTTDSISHIGALGRLSMIFSVVAMIYSTLVVPRFSRMENLRKSLLKYFLLSQFSAMLLCIALVFFIWLFSDQILWVFGSGYQHLHYELLLSAVVGGLGLVNGICSQMVVSRGWFIKPYFLIAINFVSTVLAVGAFKITSVADVLYFTMVVTILAFVLVFIYGLMKIKGSSA